MAACRCDVTHPQSKKHRKAGYVSRQVSRYLVGVVALNRKAQYGGIVSGLEEIFQEQGREDADVPGALAQQLRDTATAGDYGKRLHDR